MARRNTWVSRGRVPSTWDTGVFAAVLAFAILFLAQGKIAAQTPDEYQVKAAFLLNFPKFVSWPASAFEGPSSPLRICIFGEDPFGMDLDQLVEGESIGSRKIVVERVRRGPVPKTCRVLFISKSESEKDIAAVLAGLGPGVLTVSDRDKFLQEGGMIALVIEDRHVRFDINQRVAVKASLTLNARMLNVARAVQK